MHRRRGDLVNRTVNLTLVRLDGRDFKGRNSFHEEFAKATGGPVFYDRNVDTWMDCAVLSSKFRSKTARNSPCRFESLARGLGRFPPWALDQIAPGITR
ncbi:barstar family protein [Pelagibius sp. Alg239-R121]|uniref:barstar family protein n=1 Tax=Pelagibius sp. Alg239-R121 TaxID=2993448 RepID=UPI0034616BDE